MPKVQRRKENSRQGGLEGLRNMAVGAAASRGKLPTKRTINFAQVGLKKTNVKGAVAGVILILIAAGVFGKFAVADRLAAMTRADQETQRLQGLLEQQYARIASFEGLEEEYAHYTISGMTDEELSLVDRAKVIDMIEKETDITESSTSWSLTGNILTLTVTGNTLQDINMLARNLEKYDLVNTCSVTNAVKEEVKQSTTINANGTVTETKILVRANIVAYLEEPEKEGEETEKEGEETSKEGEETSKEGEEAESK